MLSAANIPQHVLPSASPPPPPLINNVRGVPLDWWWEGRLHSYVLKPQCEGCIAYYWSLVWDFLWQSELQIAPQETRGWTLWSVSSMNGTREAVLEAVDWLVPLGSSCLPKPWWRGRWGWEEEGGLCVFWSNASSSWSPRLRGFRLLCCRELALGWRSLCGFFSDFLLPRWMTCAPSAPPSGFPFLSSWDRLTRIWCLSFLGKRKLQYFLSYCFMGSLHFYNVTTGKHQVGEGKGVELFFFAETSLQSRPLSLTVKEEIKSFS